ncbi:MAG TPA: FtsX-like permease family protein [Steroidobacteraceae bacterium]|jgi:putative ABC transport system permease protein
MEIRPIFSALRRNKAGPMLIGLQIALTLAIVCNCLSIIQQYRAQMARPSGIDEANIFTVTNTWLGESNDTKALIGADLAALRSLPGVVDAEATNGFPLGGSGFGTGVGVKPGQTQPTASTTLYFADEHGLAVYGMKLTAGRWFGAEEVKDLHFGDTQAASSVVVTRRLALALFPSGDALGRVIYQSMATTPIRIVGIVERAQAPWAGVSRNESAVENSVFLPNRYINNYISYVVRVRPGTLASAMGALRERLYAVTRRRIILSVSTFAETRQRTYQTEHSLSLMLGVLCALLLTVTACGIIGLVLYWVAQRRRQIGMRRALGARRVDILRYFHLENLLIAGTGAAVGIAVGIAANSWLAATLILTRMSVGYICVGALIVLALSQLAVLVPALRAAAIPPAAAIRDL